MSRRIEVVKLTTRDGDAIELNLYHDDGALTIQTFAGPISVHLRFRLDEVRELIAGLERATAMIQLDGANGRTSC